MPFDGRAAAIAADAEDVWVAGGSEVARIDARARTPVGGPIDVDVISGRDLAVDDGGVWVSYPVQGAVVRIDRQTSRPDEPIEVPAGVAGPIAVGEGTVWVLANDLADNRVAVTPIDDGQLGDPIRVGDFATSRALAVGGGSVWVSDPAGDAIRRIDPARRALAPQSIALEGGAAALAVVDGALFALDGTGGRLHRFDAASGEPAGQPLPVAAGRDADLAAGAGAAWVASPDGAALLQAAW